MVGLLLGSLPGRAAARGHARLEIGPAYEYSNLIYRSTDVQFLGTVCDSVISTPGDTAAQESCLAAAVFNDSTILASAPEAAAGISARFMFSDTASADRYYYLEPALQLASKLVTGHINGVWRWGNGRGFQLGVDQRFDHSLDQRFGFSRRLDTEILTGVLGYHSADLSWNATVRPGIQIDRTDSDGDPFSDFFQDANGARLGFGLSHFTLSGGYLDLDGHVGARSYPDSALRDYRELYGAFRLGRPLPAHLHTNLLGEYERRGGDSEELRNDLYDRVHGEADVSSESDSWQARVRGSGEWMQYRRPDEVFYDTRLYRLEAGAGPILPGGLELEFKPRGEWLTAPDQGQETYRQLSLGLTATRVGPGFLDLNLEAGRRQYTGTASGVSTLLIVSTHSDYHFYSASLILTQPLLGSVRLKSSLDYSVEVHDRPEDTNHVLFLNLELGYMLDFLER
jgi:hypothetical protein